MSEKCHFCDETECLEQHHIVPRRFDGSDDEENLVTVCPTCHRKLEKLYNKDFYSEIGKKLPDADKQLIGEDRMFKCFECGLCFHSIDLTHRKVATGFYKEIPSKEQKFECPECSSSMIYLKAVGPKEDWDNAHEWVKHQTADFFRTRVRELLNYEWGDRVHAKS